MRLPPVAAAFAALLAGAVALPASAASAPAVAVPGRCYAAWPGVGAQPIPLMINGLAPRQTVRISLQVDGRTVSGVPALESDSAGGLITSIETWTTGLGDGPTGATPARIVVTDPALGTELAATDLRVANVGLEIGGGQLEASARRRWELSGLAAMSRRFGGGKVYWAYYFKGDELVGKQRIGKAGDACGNVTTRKELIPFRRAGRFALRVQASSRWRGDELPWIGTVVESQRVRTTS